MTYQLWGLLVKTLAADDKYPFLNRQNLAVPIEMQLSQKQKTFSHFFFEFLKSTLIFNIWKRRCPHIFCGSEITDSENVVR